jgi:hypothetical protein
MRFQFVVDLIEEITLCKYKGRPHWGKNFDRCHVVTASAQRA